MKTQLKLSIKASAFFYLFALIGCTLEDTAPLLEEPMINLQSENIVVEAPSEMRFDGLFSDEESIDSLEIIIQPQFLGTVSGIVNNRTAFFYAEKLNIGGKSTAVTKYITLADSAAEGEYLLTAGFQDVTGNAGDSVMLPFQMFNVSPLLTLNVNADTAFLVQQSDSLVAVNGQVLYQNTELASVNFSLEGKRFLDFDSFSKADSTLFSNNFTFALNFELPADLDTGIYTLKVIALDTLNSSSILEVPFIVQ